MHVCIIIEKKREATELFFSMKREREREREGEYEHTYT